MADDVVVSTSGGGPTSSIPTGTTFRLDDVGGVKYQIVKLDVGGDGLTVPVVGALPVSATALPLPAGASTEATLALIKAKTDNIDVLLSTRTKPADAQHVIVDSGVTTGLTDTELRATAVPVSLATAPVTHVIVDSGVTTGLTNTELRATAVPVSGTVAVTGVATAANQATEITSLANLDVALSTRTKPSDQQHVIVDANPSLLYKGTACTFRTPGRAGTTGQKILSLHNAAGSTVFVRVTKIAVDLVQTVVKAVTVQPPVIRAWKVTVLPTNGTALTKVPVDSRLTASASVTVLGDASADGTSSASALTATLPAGTIVTQEFAPRFITAAGYEAFDRVEFFSDGEEVVLGALEGIVVFLDYVLATQNPITDMWVSSVHWTEAAA